MPFVGLMERWRRRSQRKMKGEGRKGLLNK